MWRGGWVTLWPVCEFQVSSSNPTVLCKLEDTVDGAEKATGGGAVLRTMSIFSTLNPKP